MRSCVYVRASPFPESQLTALNICGVLWDNPHISFTRDKDTSYDVWPLFRALISQGIGQFMGKMGILRAMDVDVFCKLLCQIVAKTIFKQ